MARGKRLRGGKRLQKKSLLNRIEMIFQDLEYVNWHVEIVKSILTALIIFIISTTILGTIAYFSPGEYSDSRLTQYLLKTITQEIELEHSETQMSISRLLYGFQNGLDVKDVIVLCGEYATDPSFPDGYYICIFEREPKSFFNDSFGTEPKYVPTFIRTIDSYHAGFEMLCVACEAVDVDGDGFMEIRLEYLAGFADRGSEIVAIIELVDGKWSVISPDLSTVEEEAAKIANKDVMPHIDSFPLTNPRDPNGEGEILYGLYNGGKILPVANFWTGGINWLYCIPVRYDIESYPYRNYAYAFVMERLTENEMVREPDWNIGSIYFPEHEDREIEEFVDDLWGWSSSKEYNIPWNN